MRLHLKTGNIDLTPGSLRICFILIALLVVLPAIAISQSRSTITGYVFAPGRRPVAQLPVELRNDVNSVIGRTRTDGTGRYFFAGVPTGRFTITVLALGTDLENQSLEAEVGSIGARGLPVAENVQLDFYLKAKKSGEGHGENEVVFAQDVPDEAKRLYQNAISDLDSKRTVQGLDELNRALQIFPTYFLALERLGIEQLRQEAFEDALKTFNSAVAVNQRSFWCWYGLTYANFALKNWNEVIQSAEKALEQDRNSVNTLLLLGIAQRTLKKFPEAERSLSRARKIDDGKTPDLYWNLALLYAYNLKKYQDAADALEIYLKVNPTTPDSENIKKLIKRFRANQPPS